jgi:hypothetical protein
MAAPLGNNFSPGRPKGSSNETTKKIKQVFADLLEGREEELNYALNQLRDSNPRAYLELYVKISERFVGPVSRQVLEDNEGNSIQPIQIVIPPKPE